jgi:hypothetical protein
MLNEQVYIGSWVKIKRHFDDDSWVREMNDYENEETIISDFTTDYLGNYVCRVTVDKGSYMWSKNSLVLKSQDVSLIKTRSRVILGSHDWLRGTRDWMPSMEKFIGKQAIIKKIFDFDKIMYGTVDITDSCWRLCNMILVE